MKAEIVSIKAENNIILCYEGKPICPTEPIWQHCEERTAEKSFSRPAAFSPGLFSPPALEVTLRIYDGKGRNKYLLHGKDEKGKIMFSGKTWTNYTKSDIVIKASSLFAPDGFFKMDGEQLNWIITDVKSNITSELSPVRFELYWLFGYDNSLFKRGIPVEILSGLNNSFDIHGNVYYGGFGRILVLFKKILRQLGVKGFRLADVSKEKVIAAVVNSIFERNPPRYDVNGIRSRCYISNDGTNNGIVFYLRKYLKAVDDPEAVCDCYDQAAILQYFLRLFGIKNVLYGYIGDFGFIKTTGLVGRGCCNNPVFGENGSKPIVKAMSDKRSCFEFHSFCYLGEFNWIVDSCIGPHTGEETPEEYFKNTIDKINYRNHTGLSRIPRKESYYKGVKYVDWSIATREMPNLPETKKFMETLGCSKKEISKFPSGYVVCDWSELPKNMVSFKNGWIVAWQDLVPGEGEVKQIWILKNENDDKKYIQIELYISSADNLAAFYRFLLLGSLTSHSQLHFCHEQKNKGYYLVNLQIGEHSRYIGVNRNVVFDIYIPNNKIDGNELLRCIDDYFFKPENIINDLSAALPMLEYQCPLNGTLRVGENVEINVQTQSEALCDFNLEGRALRINDEKDNIYSFMAQRKSTKGDRLMLGVVDKKTLLVRNKEVDFRVRGKWF